MAHAVDIETLSKKFRSSPIGSQKGIVELGGTTQGYLFQLPAQGMHRSSLTTLFQQNICLTCSLNFPGMEISVSLGNLLQCLHTLQVRKFLFISKETMLAIPSKQPWIYFHALCS